MKKNKYVTQEFISAITKEAAKLIAANEHQSVDDAKKLFMASKVYDYLCNPPEPFYEEDPEYFYEMYENLKNKGIMLDNNELYLKENPQLYSLDVH